MRRCTLLACLTLMVGLVTPLLMAAPPAHGRFTLSFAIDNPAGTFCDFVYHGQFTADQKVTFFQDGSSLVHLEFFAAHTNLGIPLTLSEVDHLNFQFSPSKQRYRQAGLNTHLRTPDGKIVLVEAGQILWDTGTWPWEIVKVTPNISPDAAAVLCPALGGNPANPAP